MADKKTTKKAPAVKKDGLRGKAAFDAVIYYLRMAMGHTDPAGRDATAYRNMAESIFQTLPPDRRALVNLVRGSLTPLDPATQSGVVNGDNVILYAQSSRPAQDQVKFVSVPLSIDELAQLKALAGQSPQGSMSGIVADLVRKYLASQAA